MKDNNCYRTFVFFLDNLKRITYTHFIDDALIHWKFASFSYTHETNKKSLRYLFDRLHRDTYTHMQIIVTDSPHIQRYQNTKSGDWI